MFPKVTPTVKTTKWEKYGGLAGPKFLFLDSEVHRSRYGIVETLVVPLVIVEAEVRLQATGQRRERWGSIPRPIRCCSVLCIWFWHIGEIVVNERYQVDPQASLGENHLRSSPDSLHPEELARRL